jgi:hypothetical protein
LCHRSRFCGIRPGFVFKKLDKVEPAPDAKEQSQQTKAAAATGARARVIPEFTNFPIPQALLKDHGYF